ncbi:MAG: glycosyltransferase family 2 protein, partial [Bacteroidota bacterium]
QEFTQPNLKVLNLMQYLGNPGEYLPNKKKAIALGIKNAKGELIITTDGDCVSQESWIRTMVDFYIANEFKLVTAPVMVKPALFPLQIFQQLDVINLLGITAATIRNNFPTMCNGANLMYEKKTFLDVEGFKGNHDVATGDDVFLMHKIKELHPNSIGFIKNFDACVFTKPEKGIGKFISQRIRWISKSTHFTNWRVTAILYFAYFFNLLVVVTALFAFPISEFSWLPLAVVGGTKLVADFLFSIPVAIFFHKIVLLLLLPIIEFFHVLYVIIIGLLSLTGKYKWKDRAVK